MSNEKNWFLLINGESDGPHSEADIVARIRSGELGPQTQAYGPGADSWRPLAEIPHLAAAAGGGPPPAAPARPAQPTMAPILAPAVAHQAEASGSTGSTVQLRRDKASEYTRLNFLLRLLGVYYVLYVAHFFLWVGYCYAACVVWVLDMILAIIGGEHHAGLVAFEQRFLRFNVRMTASAMGLTEEIPHIDMNVRGEGFPVDLELQPEMAISRGAVILRLSGIICVMLIPHLLALGILGLAGSLAFVVGFFAVLFTGAWPDAIWNFLVGLIRWQLRVTEYVFGLSTVYPAFGLK